MNAQVQNNFADQLWRLNNLYYITDKQGRRVRFNLNTAQEDLYHSLWYRNVILKARQRGFTTFLDVYALDSCLFNTGFTAGIVAHNLDDAKKIFRTKVKFPYENLPEGLRNTIKPVNDSANEYIFSNDSSISVSTSYRSGTLQFLHVSEFGKIAAKNPEKAMEIITGALEAVPLDGLVAFESTAEGNGGKFFDMVDQAKKNQEEGKKLNPLEFKFIFEPWHNNPEYTLDGDVTITSELQDYYDRLKADSGIKLSKGQKRWYAAKSATQGEKMKREYPSTAEEAFEVAIEGAYWADLMTKARQENRVTRIPIEESLEVHTAWDLGRNDANSIWFFQHIGKEYRFIEYYENSGQGLKFYARILKDMKDKYGWRYGTHYLPHDVEVTELSSEEDLSRKEILEAAGVKPIEKVVRVSDKTIAIEAVRNMLPYCWFDKERCAQGIKCLDNFRHQWDERNGVFLPEPMRDWSKHGADAIMQVAQGFDPDNGVSDFFAMDISD